MTPVGRAPVSLNVGAGEPLAVTVNVPAAPTANVVWFALVIAAPCTTVKVKLWMELGAIPLLAMMLIGYEPPVPAAGVPVNTPKLLKVTPLGRAPDSLNVGDGVPRAVTVNVPTEPMEKVVALALVMTGP